VPAFAAATSLAHFSRLPLPAAPGPCLGRPNSGRGRTESVRALPERAEIQFGRRPFKPHGKGPKTGLYIVWTSASARLQAVSAGPSPRQQLPRRRPTARWARALGSKGLFSIPEDLDRGHSDVVDRQRYEGRRSAHMDEFYSGSDRASGLRTQAGANFRAGPAYVKPGTLKAIRGMSMEPTASAASLTPVCGCCQQLAAAFGSP
jgi:hypothetical protein